jgi:uncharacterized membrane protein YGL010W
MGAIRKFHIAVTDRFGMFHALKRGKGPPMTAYLQRQLADYVEYHRDPRNCAMHVLGILLLFLGATLPLSMWSVSLLGVQTTVAALLALPVLVYWLILDFTLGLAIAGVAILLLSTAMVIINHTPLAGVWITTAVLVVAGVASQIIGHRVFEQRQPALVDNPSHLLLGPVFVMAKLFIALGFRHDLAAIIGPTAPLAGRGASLYADDR